MSDGLNEKICDKLNKPVPTHTRQGQGGTFSYHKGSDVIRRLNEAFSHCWSSEKLETEVVEDQVLMLVALSVFIDGDTVMHHGYGSADIARGRGNSKIMNIGNTYKSAFTNALKKAAEQFGIGLEDESTVSNKPAPNYKSARPPAQQAPQTQRTEMPSRPVMASRPAMAPRGDTPPSPTEAPPAPLWSSTPKTSAVVPPPDSPPPMVAPISSSDLVSPTQEHALKRLASMKNLTEKEMVTGALPDSGKLFFKDLLRSEASVVIKYTNVQPQGNS